VSRTYSRLATRVVTAVILIGALLGALFLLPPPWLAGLIAVLVGLAGFEWARLCRLHDPVTFGYAILIAAGAILLYLSPMEFKRAAFLMSALFWLLAAPAWLWRGMSARQAPTLAASGFIVLVPAALAMMVLPPQAVLIVLGLVWVADTAAYFVGSRFGRHKLAPAISPGKTWEGAGGALAGTLAYAIACGALVPQLKTGVAGKLWIAYLAAAAGLCALSILGDLFESAAKRQAQVKDSGTLLPGHGGILDRIDSATSTLPLAALLWPLIGAK
jgi:phosphatidate cytidylyltransferase